MYNYNTINSSIMIHEPQRNRFLVLVLLLVLRFKFFKLKFKLFKFLIIKLYYIINII